MKGMDTPVKYSPLHTLFSQKNVVWMEKGDWRVPAQFREPEVSARIARESVVLADRSSMGKYLVEGKDADAFVGSFWGLAGLEIGGGEKAPVGHLYRLRSDQYFLHTEVELPVDDAASLHSAAAAHGTLVTVTDLTQARAGLLLVGPKSAGLLSLLCGLDFRPDVFPSPSARQTSVAKTKQLVIRRDLRGLPAYHLIGDRSLGVYHWETIMKAGEKLGVVGIGLHALDRLKNDA